MSFKTTVQKFSKISFVVGVLLAVPVWAPAETEDDRIETVVAGLPEELRQLIRSFVSKLKALHGEWPRLLEDEKLQRINELLAGVFEYLTASFKTSGEYPKRYKLYEALAAVVANYASAENIAGWIEIELWEREDWFFEYHEEAGGCFGRLYSQAIEKKRISSDASSSSGSSSATK